MTEEEKKNIKTKIESEIRVIEGSLPGLEEGADVVAPDAALGRLTRMEALASRGISEANLAEARLRLESLRNAYKRVDNPEYGVCKKCGAPIAPARLEYFPETEMCVNCA